MKIDNWFPRDSHVCGTCAHFNEKGNKKTAELPRGFVGRCKWYPPTHRGFPVVFSGDPACGHHKLDEERV